MDLAAALSVNSQVALRTDASYKVAAITMDVVEQNSAALIALMEQSVNPHIGSNIDMKL